jgi:transcriptional repressor NrdR
VIKKNGQREPFDRDRLARSIYAALRKRPHESDRVERIKFNGAPTRKLWRN